MMAHMTEGKKCIFTFDNVLPYTVEMTKLASFRAPWLLFAYSLSGVPSPKKGLSITLLPLIFRFNH